MALSLQQFINTYNGRAVDFDGYYGAQCVDLIQFYNRDVVGVGRFTGDAINIYGQLGNSYTWVRNTPAGIPRPGSVVVWGAPYGYNPTLKRYFGHVAIVVSANLNTMTVLSQNYPYNTGTAFRTLSYNGCIGWGTPKNVSVGTPPPATGVTPVMRTVTVTVTTLNVRSGPATSFPGGQANRAYNPDGNLHYGAVVQITGYTHGQNIGGTSDVWLRTVNNHWIWSGGTNW